MNIGPLGGPGASAAGSPLAQTGGPEADRAAHRASNAARRTQQQHNAEDAAGVGQPDGEHHDTDDHDPDGRRPWERPPDGAGKTAGAKRTSDRRHRSIDDGRGSLLDASG